MTTDTASTSGEVRPMDVLISIDNARELLDEHMYSHTLVHARKRIAELIGAADAMTFHPTENEINRLWAAVRACRATQGANP